MDLKILNEVLIFIKGEKKSLDSKILKTIDKETIETINNLADMVKVAQKWYKKGTHRGKVHNMFLKVEGILSSPNLSQNDKEKGYDMILLGRDEIEKTMSNYSLAMFNKRLKELKEFTKDEYKKWYMTKGFWDKDTKNKYIKEIIKKTK